MPRMRSAQQPPSYSKSFLEIHLFRDNETDVNFQGVPAVFIGNLVFVATCYEKPRCAGMSRACAKLVGSFKYPLMALAVCAADIDASLPQEILHEHV